MELHKHSEVMTEEKEFWTVLSTAKNCQVALMRLMPDQTSGEYGNEHPDSDQVLFVMEGHGKARVEDKTVELEDGDILIINAGEKHQIVADGAASLHTLNIYSPVAYPDEK